MVSFFFNVAVDVDPLDERENEKTSVVDLAEDDSSSVVGKDDSTLEMESDEIVEAEVNGSLNETIVDRSVSLWQRS